MRKELPGGDVRSADGSAWLSHAEGAGGVDDAGAVLLAWRVDAGCTQVDVAGVLGTTQQHISQIETGQRPVSLELRRKMVIELGIAADHLGLSSGFTRGLVSPDDASPEVAASRLRWRNERRWLNQHRSELATLAVQLYPAEYRLPRTTGLRFERYTSAIKHVSPPALFWSGPTYRLLDVSLASHRLEFGLAVYFDRLDVSEALGHEMAAVCMSDGLPRSAERLRGRLPFRELVGDPFDLRRRAVNPGVATLTIRLRRYPAEPSFLLHWRDPAKVATAGGIYSVIPTGEFEPSSTALWDWRNDFDLWRNMVREYSEELLGEPEHDSTRSQPIDYERWPLFQQLEAARADGSVGAFFLGLGLDALTLTAAILTVVVIDDEVFTDVFGSAVRFNEEGEIVAVGGGTPTEGVPFTEAAVRRMLETEPMAESGSACLALAWRHRHALGL